MDLRTDFAPGSEFDAIRVRIGDGDVAVIADSLVNIDTDYVRGARVADSSVGLGQTPVTVTLVRAGAAVISRRVLVSVVPPVTVATVVITRSCEGVECPNDNPAFDSCFGGSCVDPRCTAETPEFCPPPACTTDTECSAAAACAEAICQDNVCLSVPRNASCAADERCDVEFDCVPSMFFDAGPPMDGGTDAGMGDAGSEGDARVCDPGPSDGGPPDAGPTLSDAVYISPRGSDDGDGSREQPWATFSHALARLFPGRTLVLLAGSYEEFPTGYIDIQCDVGTTACDGAPCQSGTEGAPITILAEEPRRALIHTTEDVGDVPLLRIDGCEHYIIDGLTLVGQDGYGWNNVDIIESRNVHLRNSLIAQNTRHANTQLIAVTNSHDILIEGNELYDFHRNAISAFGCMDVTARLNYINARGRADAPGHASEDPSTGDVGFSCNSSGRCIAENNVFIGANRNIHLRTSAETFERSSRAGDNARVLGNIFRGGSYGVLATSECENMPSCTSIPERVITDLDIAQNVFQSQAEYGVSVEGARQADILANSFFDSTIRVVRSVENASLACSASVTRNIVQASGTAIFIEEQEESLSVTMNNTFPGAIVSDVDIESDNNTRIDPLLGACLHRVPDDSPVSPSRGQIGARLVNRYVGGDQRTTPLWTVERAFPCGAIVEGINDGAADTCTTFDALGIDRLCCL